MIRKTSMPEFELYQSLDNAGKQRFIEEIRQKVQNHSFILIQLSFFNEGEKNNYNCCCLSSFFL